MPRSRPVLTSFSRYRLRRARALALDLCARLAGFLPLAVCALFWADRVFALSRSVRMALLVFVSAGGLALAGRAVGAGLRGLADGALARDVASRIPALGNYLASAVSLVKHGLRGPVSAELAQAHIRVTDRLLKEHEAEPVFPLRVTRGAAVLLCCGFICGAATAPFALRDPDCLMRALAPVKIIPAETYFEIRPGDIAVPRGAPVAITVLDKTGSGRVPVLELKAERGPWLAGHFSARGGVFFAALERVTEPVYYRVRWRDLASRAYLVSPRDYPALTGVTARIFPPSYSGRAAYEEAAPEGAQALRASRVTVSGKTAQPLSRAELVRAVSSGGSSLLQPPVMLTRGRGGVYSASFPLQGDTEFWFRLVSADGWADPAPFKYSLRAAPDNPPAAAVLSPSYETESSPGDTVPVVYEAADDIGLLALSVDYETVINGAAVPELSGSRVIRRYRPPGPVRQLGDTVLSLAGYPDGARVNLTVSAFDGSGAAGKSAPSVIIVRDYAARHIRAEAGMMAVERGLLELARSYAETADALAGSTAAFTNMTDRSLARQWRELAAEFDGLLAVSESDAYLNDGVRQELRSLSAKREYLGGTEAGRFARSARNGEPGAPQTARVLARELGRMAKSVAAQRKFQFYKDFENAAYNMSDTQDSLENVLKDFAKNGGAGATRQEWAQLESNLAQIQRQLDELNALISSMPDLREVNGQDERRLHYVPVAKAKDLAARLMQALKERDFKKAAGLAAELSEQLGRMRKAFEEAAGDYADSGED
ncbi:MAG: hypothetical protein PHW69_04235, partial [Elusimicrobiaceae bacterium]|nr:hypothetical protein [Elusimicrobiaceae bacterium]